MPNVQIYGLTDDEWEVFKDHCRSRRETVTKTISRWIRNCIRGKELDGIKTV